MAKKKDDGDRSLLPDDDADKPLESLARKQARLESEIKKAKGELEQVSERITVALKAKPKRAYVRGPFRLYIEAKDKLHVEVSNETGEA